MLDLTENHSSKIVISLHMSQMIGWKKLVQPMYSFCMHISFDKMCSAFLMFNHTWIMVWILLMELNGYSPHSQLNICHTLWEFLPAMKARQTHRRFYQISSLIAFCRKISTNVFTFSIFSSLPRPPTYLKIFIPRKMYSSLLDLISHPWKVSGI